MALLYGHTEWSIFLPLNDLTGTGGGQVSGDDCAPFTLIPTAFCPFMPKIPPK
jgi:hypothetical protein